MIVTTKHEVISHDSKTACAHKLQPIPEGTAVRIKDVYSNFYGRYYDVEWNGNIYSVNDNDICIDFDESDWTITLKCPCCGKERTVELSRRKDIIQDPWYDKYPVHVKISDLMEITESIYAVCPTLLCHHEAYISQGGLIPNKVVDISCTYYRKIP